MLHAIIIGRSGAIAMNLTVHKNTSWKTMKETGNSYSSYLKQFLEDTSKNEY